MKRILTWIFNISLVIFMVLGVIIVATQLISVILRNGALAIGVSKALKIWAIRASIVTAFCSFIMSYMKEKN